MKDEKTETGYDYARSDVTSERLMSAAKALRTVPANIADIFGVNPECIERLLLRRGQRCGEGESLRNCVARHYGEQAATEMDALFNEENGGSKWFIRT